MSRNIQGVVAIIFVVMGLSFVATTAVLAIEFRNSDWFALAAFYSHLFLFFPTFGLLALAAFYIPTCTLIDLYWNHVPHGRIRFGVMTVCLIAASVHLGVLLVAGDVPALWWMRPESLAADKGDPVGCASVGEAVVTKSGEAVVTKSGEAVVAKSSEAVAAKGGAASGAQCRRYPVMTSVEAIRKESRLRAGLSPFVRECKPDPLIEIPADLLQKRFCFVTMTKTTAAECCNSQIVFTTGMSQMYANERAHSATGQVHALLLPIKIFFLVMILLIGVVLAAWRRTIDKHYHAYTARIERGLLIGALAMLIWPVSNHGFLQSSSLLYGKFGEGFYATLSPVLSFCFAAWAMLLVLFFFRRFQRDLEAAGKIGGGIASAVAILKYNEIIDYGTRFLGSGADPRELAVMAGVLVAAFVALYSGAQVPQTLPTPPDPT